MTGRTISATYNGRAYEEEGTMGTQTLESQYGRDSLTVDDSIPTFALQRKLGNVHVGTSRAEVGAMIIEAISGSPDASQFTLERTAQTISAALWIHAENLAEYQWVMGSH